MNLVYFYRLLIGIAILCISSIYSQAQVKLIFEVPGLVVDAGKDTTINKGEEIVLGGAATASGGEGYNYQWTPSHGLKDISIANPIASPDFTTTYTVTVTDASGCSKSSNVLIIVNYTPEIVALNNKLGLNIFPNPTTGKLSVTTAEELAGETVKLEIITPLGSILYHESIKDMVTKLEKTIDLSNHSKGLYVIRLSGNGYSIVKKILN